jgi:hypothetical protein
MSHSYPRLVREIESSLERLDGAIVESVGVITHDEGSWPMLCARSAPWDRTRPTVLISGGVHGDEPAGVHAALAFLAEGQREFRNALQFVIFPCVNPSGFEAGTLETRSGANLNRLFGLGSIEPEVRAIEDWLEESALQFRMTFDLHEVRPDYVGEGFSEKDNPRGAYLYEFARDGSERVGRAMIDGLPPDRTVCDWPTIYNDVNRGGVITYPDDRRNAIFAKGTSLDAYLNERYAKHSFTLETPTGWPLRDRIDTHVSFLRTALRHSALLSASRGTVANIANSYSHR